MYNYILPIPYALLCSHAIASCADPRNLASSVCKPGAHTLLRRHRISSLFSSFSQSQRQLHLSFPSKIPQPHPLAYNFCSIVPTTSYKCRWPVCRLDKMFPDGPCRLQMGRPICRRDASPDGLEHHHITSNIEKK